MSKVQKSVLLPFDKYQRLIAHRDAHRLNTNSPSDDKKTIIRQLPADTPKPPGIPVTTQRRRTKTNLHKRWIEV